MRHALRGIGLLILCIHANAAIALVAHTLKVGANNTNTETSTAINCTGASLLTVTGATYQSHPYVLGDISDSSTNTWAIAKAVVSSGSPLFGDSTTLFYAKNPTVTSTHTATLTGAYQSFVFACYSGTDTTSPLDVTSGNIGSGTTIQPGSLTPNQNGSLLITWAGNESGLTSMSVDSGFTITDQDNNSAQVNIANAYLIQSTAAAINPTWSNAVSVGITGMAVFKPPASTGIRHRKKGVL